VLLVSLLENNPRLVSGKFGADFSFDDSIKKWKSIIYELESCLTAQKGKVLMTGNELVPNIICILLYFILFEKLMFFRAN